MVALADQLVVAAAAAVVAVVVAAVVAAVAIASEGFVDQKPVLGYSSFADLVASQAYHFERP